MSALSAGLHFGIPAKAYHEDPCPVPSLSSGIARTILSESVAHAHLAHPKLGGAGKESTFSMNLGTILHSLMDDNPEKDFVVGPFDSYKSGEARAWRDRIALSGKTPALERDMEGARPIEQALRSKVFIPPSSMSEVTAVWREGDVWCRARYDRLHRDGTSARVWDWKTCSGDMSDRGIVRTIVKYGYHIQVAFYLRGLVAVTELPAKSLHFTLVFVSVKAPHTVRCVRLTDLFLAEGHKQAKLAIEKWDTALKTGNWSDPREAEVMEADMPLWMDDVEVEITGS